MPDELHILHSVAQTLLQRPSSEGVLLGGLCVEDRLCIVVCAAAAEFGTKVWFPDGVEVCGTFGGACQAEHSSDASCETTSPVTLTSVDGQLTAQRGTQTLTLVVEESLNEVYKASLRGLHAVVVTTVSAERAEANGPVQLRADALTYDPGSIECLFLHNDGSAPVPQALNVDSLPPPAHAFQTSRAAAAVAPYLTYDAQRVHCTRLPVVIEVFAVFPEPLSAAEQQRRLQSTAAKRLQAAIDATQAWCNSARTVPSGITIAHYRPPSQGVPLAALYPADAESLTLDEGLAALQAWRAGLHKATLSDTSRPLFRLSQRLQAGHIAGADDRSKLRDVHSGLPPSGVSGGKQYLMQGSYVYHHYMQDSFNDKGWGCAYRSLQTIWSWFRLQGFTNKAVPSHREIQLELAKAGDKPASFVGSKQWVGAIELGLVLQIMLGLDYRVISMSSGSDMPKKAGEIAEHFQTEGTPIMVGGGVLAYTLLGIDWNQETGEVAFLILDPHYTGQDNLQKVVSGNWIAWKKLGQQAAAGGPLFVPSSFYNLMCPQRPRGV